MTPHLRDVGLERPGAAETWRGLLTGMTGWPMKAAGLLADTWGGTAGSSKEGLDRSLSYVYEEQCWLWVGLVLLQPCAHCDRWQCMQAVHCMHAWVKAHRCKVHV